MPRKSTWSLSHSRVRLRTLFDMACRDFAAEAPSACLSELHLSIPPEMVEDLRDELKSSARERRAVAAQCLGQAQHLDQVVCVEMLKNALGSEADPFVIDHVLSALAFREHRVEDIGRFLRHSDGVVRAAAVWHIQATFIRDDVRTLVSVLDDEDPDVVSAASEALLDGAELGSVACAEQVFERRLDPSGECLREFFRSICRSVLTRLDSRDLAVPSVRRYRGPKGSWPDGRRPTEHEVKILLDILAEQATREEEPSSRLAGWLALDADEFSLPIVLGLAEQSPADRCVALALLKAPGRGVCGPSLATELEVGLRRYADDDELCAAVLDAMGARGLLPEAYEAYLDSSSVEVRLAALRWVGLSSWGDGTLARLRDRLTDPVDLVASLAARMLVLGCEQGSFRVLELAVEASEDARSDLSCSVYEAIVLFGIEEARLDGLLDSVRRDLVTADGADVILTRAKSAFC